MKSKVKKSKESKCKVFEKELKIRGQLVSNALYSQGMRGPQKFQSFTPCLV